MNVLWLSFLLLSADGWRVNGLGVFPNAKPVTTWSSSEHIAWKTKLPDWSNAQPLLLGQLLFVHAEPSTLICVDAMSGKVLWKAANEYEDLLSSAEVAEKKRGVAEKAAPLRKEMDELNKKMEAIRAKIRETGDRSLRSEMGPMRKRVQELKATLGKVDPFDKPSTHEDCGFTSAVPVTDGRNIYSVFGNGVIAAYGSKGNRLWARVLEKPVHRWGHSASPFVHDGKLIVHIHDLVAIDTKTGKELWRHAAEPAFGSPVLAKIAGEPVVITAGKGDVVKLADGSLVKAGLKGLSYATPLVKDDKVYFLEKQSAAFALPKSFDGEFKELWTSRMKGSRHYASSVIHNGLIYSVSRESWLTVLEEDTGTFVYEKKLGLNQDTNSVYPSLSLAGKHLYIGFEEGIVLVIKPGRTYEEVAKNELEKFRATPTFDGKRIFYRGLDHLYCIAK